MKIKALLYCTKNKMNLRKSIKDKCYYLDNGSEFNIIPDEDYALNGKIVAECDYEVEKIRTYLDNCYDTKTLGGFALQSRSCLNAIELDNYLKGKNGKAIYIKNLHIFDKPKELSECHKKYGGKNYFPISYMPITAAPQNMIKVWLYENGKWVMYILISIQPQWMCKILNGEKDVEVRKVVLKEMLSNE